MDSTIRQHNSTRKLTSQHESIPATNRWYPVLQRYVQQVSGRVDGFGGNAGSVNPSQQGIGGGVVGHHPECDEFTGKVAGVIYDRFGDFEGFALITEGGYEHRFRSRENENRAARALRLG